MDSSNPAGASTDEIANRDRVFESAAELFGVLAKRREGTQIYYRLQSGRVAMLCRAVCTQIVVELDGDADLEAGDRLVPLAHR